MYLCTDVFIYIYEYIDNGILNDLITISIRIAFVFHLHVAPFQHAPPLLKQPFLPTVKCAKHLNKDRPNGLLRILF